MKAAENESRPESESNKAEPAAADADFRARARELVDGVEGDLRIAAQFMLPGGEKSATNIDMARALIISARENLRLLAAALGPVKR